MNMQVTLNQDIARMQLLLAEQRKAYRANPMPTKKERIAHLKGLKVALLKYKDKLAEAVSEDYSNRSKDETFIMEIMAGVNAIKYTIKQVGGWMKPSKRHVDIPMQPASAQVMYQPLGVIGVAVPWNFPIGMTLQPLICALGAGNRAMIKLSEFTPRCNEVIREMLAYAFEEDHVAVVTGEADVAAAFTSLPFDHLLFTGSTPVGKHVMRAAAENLTPVTLELGGKSPTIIDDKVPLADMMDRIVFGKMVNGGQTCIAPDYILCPKSRRSEVVDHFKKNFSTMFPSIKDNDDYTAIVNDRQYQRLQGLLVDAEAKGAKIIQINPANDDLSTGTRKIAPHLVLDTTEDMTLMSEEIFGPILPIITYDDFDEVIEYVNDRPRPLALYLFSYDKAKQERVVNETHSGAVCINETTLHAGFDTLPFGGIGPSGMGHYHGWEGFETMSKAKAVLKKGKFNPAKNVHAPYGRPFHKFFYWAHLR